MAIETNCASCGRTLRAKDELAGKRVKCPDCGSAVAIPLAATAASEPEETFDFDLSDERGGDSLDNELDGLPAVDGDRKPCPACGEMIKASAKKCRYCDEIFDPALKKAAVKNDVDGDMTTGDWVIAIICPGIGCIAGIVWMIQGKPKGTKMFGISFLAGFVWNVIRFGLAAANGNL